MLSETYTLIRRRANHKLAVKFMRKFPASGVKILKSTDSIIEDAKNIFIKYEDKDFSFVDCISFAMINRHKIDYVLTFDKHFKLYRFKHTLKIIS